MNGNIRLTKESSGVYTKNDMNDILFSGQKKKLAKIDKIIFCVFSVYTFAILMIMFFAYKNDVVTEVFFSVGILSMNTFVYTGYKWMNKSPFNVKKERKWFIASCILGAMMPLIKFTSSISSMQFASIWFMPITYMVFMTIRESLSLKSRKLYNAGLVVRNLGIILRVWLLLTCFVAFVFTAGFVSFSEGTIAFAAIMAIVAIVLVILMLIFSRGINLRLFLEGIGSTIVIPLATIVGVFSWSVVVFAMTFEFGAISFAGAAIQIALLGICVFILLKGKNEFAAPFVKSFVSNLFLLFIGAIGIGSKSLDGNGSGSFVNSLIFGLSAVVIYMTLYLKNVKRSKKYVLLEGLTINVLVFSLLATTILQSVGTLNVSKDIDIQTILTGICLLPLFLNSFMSTVGWIKTLNFKEREKIWK